MKTKRFKVHFETSNNRYCTTVTAGSAGYAIRNVLDEANNKPQKYDDFALIDLVSCTELPEVKSNYLVDTIDTSKEPDILT